MRNTKTIQKEEVLERGTRVLANGGYAGSVIRKYADTMYEIRLDSGTTCIDRSDFDLDIAMGEG